MAFKIIILSRKPSNVVPCIESIFKYDPTIPKENILVVDDGARTPETEHLGVTWVEGIQPFVFARNANLGIKYANSDVILLNDDTELASVNGLTALAHSEQRGITSAKIIGPGRTDVDKFVAFVCVFIPKVTQEAVGLLDERFSLYGYEDDDYCKRLRLQNLPISVCSECVINHYHPDRSTFHGPEGLYKGDNLVAFDRKWDIKREYTWPEHLAEIAKQ